MENFLTCQNSTIPILSPAEASFLRWDQRLTITGEPGSYFRSVVSRIGRLRDRKATFRLGDKSVDLPEIHEKSQERGVQYAVRIPANDSLARDIAELLTRPVGRSYRRYTWRTAGSGWSGCVRRSAAKLRSSRNSPRTWMRLREPRWMCCWRPGATFW